MATDTLDKIEFDFKALEESMEAKPCEGTVGLRGDPCPRQAKWAVWMAHDYRKCPMTVNMCEDHKANAIKIWEHLITCPKNHSCPKCKQGLLGKQLNEVLRFLEL